MRALLLLVVLVVLGGGLYQRWQEHRVLAEFPPPGTFIDVGGYTLHLWCRGEGSPTVVIDPGGYGGSTLYARGLSEALARDHRTCVYDPPGQGWSDLGPDPGSLVGRFRAFRSMIEGSDIDGPFVLVAESSGAHVARLFTAARPSRVSGLVLVDPAFDDLERDRRHWSSADRKRAARLRRLAPVVRALSHIGLHRPLLGPMIARTSEAYPHPPQIRAAMREQALSRKSVAVLIERTLHRDDGLSRVREAVPPSRLPLFVLTAGDGQTEPRTPYQREKVTYHRELSRLSERGRHLVVEDASHSVIVDRPDRVVAAVRSVLSMEDGS